MTKIAEFDIEIHLGAGMPNNKSFIYEATIELLREGAITQEEARATLKDVLNWPITLGAKALLFKCKPGTIGA